MYVTESEKYSRCRAEMLSLQQELPSPGGVGVTENPTHHSSPVTCFREALWLVVHEADKSWASHPLTYLPISPYPLPDSPFYIMRIISN